MAGYLGTKAVLLSTTAADVVGNAEIGGSLSVSGAFTSQGIDDNASATAMTLDASGNVGIGTSSPTFTSAYGGLHVHSTYPEIHLTGTDSGSGAGDGFKIQKNSANHVYLWNYENAFMAFGTNNAEAMRIDSSGNLLVGKTALSGSTTGTEIFSVGLGRFVRSGGDVLNLNRLSTHGTIVDFQKDSTTVGSIESRSGNSLSINTGSSGILSLSGASSNHIEVLNSSASGTPRLRPSADNTVDLGDVGRRFDDVYATNGTIQTSDRNEKQDIEALSDAEQRVAVACKGLLRKFRWKDAVAEKGDDARIHFGIIAQDLQDAFAAEGLDAGRYAMFISSTWWETQTDVPTVEAVEAVYEDVVIPAVLDEDGNEVEAERTEQQLVTEAVEAKEAYTRTDTYETLEEAPEGATERTRLGVRYPELLAFIIGAM
jgi:hypothetical protein